MLSRSGQAAVLASCLLALPAASAETVAVRVIDGDTFVLNGETVRIEGIDAPELRGSSRCLAEQYLAEQAKEALTELFERCEIALYRHGHDRYGRTVARVTACDRDVGTALMVGKVAAPWGGHPVDWCGVP